MTWTPWAVWSAISTQDGKTNWIAVDEGTPQHCEEGAARRNANAMELDIDARFMAAPNYPTGR